MLFRSELNSAYLQGALSRFNGNVEDNAKTKASSYAIPTPCGVPVDENEVKLIANGGKTR